MWIKFALKLFQLRQTLKLVNAAKYKNFARLILGLQLSLCVSGCATIKSLDASVPVFEKVFLFCGTRLNWAVISEDDIALRKFKVDPPGYPWLDLPLSLSLDALLLPLTVSAEVFH